MDLSELSQVIEQYAMRREERLELDRKSKEVGELENELKQTIMAHLLEQKVYVAGSPHVTVRLKITPKPSLFFSIGGAQALNINLCVRYQPDPRAAA